MKESEQNSKPTANELSQAREHLEYSINNLFRANDHMGIVELAVCVNVILEFLEQKNK